MVEALLFDWLAERHRDPSAAEAGARIERAVRTLLADGTCVTADIGGTAGTSDIALAVADALFDSAEEPARNAPVATTDGRPQ